MHKRLIMVALLSVALVGFSSCPATRISAGTWLFAIAEDGGPFTASRALDLLGDGSTQDPDPIPPNRSLFVGNVTWMQNDGTFTLSQVNLNANATYTTPALSTQGPVWTVPGHQTLERPVHGARKNCNKRQVYAQYDLSGAAQSVSMTMACGMLDENSRRIRYEGSLS